MTTKATLYDIVIAGGRVIDPESGLDAVRNVGIGGGSVEAVTDAALSGRTTVDAAGMVVCPGFIDLHSHGQDSENYRVQAMDGVTTALELEVGIDDVERWYAEREGKAVINYGASAGHIPVRMSVMRDPGDFLPAGDAAHRAASDSEVAEMTRMVQHGIERGALAVGFGLCTRRRPPDGRCWRCIALRHSTVLRTTSTCVAGGCASPTAASRRWER